MVLPCSRGLIPCQSRVFSAVLSLILASLLSQSNLHAQVPVVRSAAPAVEPAEKAPIPAKDAGKYDIAHIGDRGIGRGFNFYSLKREHQLGQSLAAAFDRYSRIVNDEVVKIGRAHV